MQPNDSLRRTRGNWLLPAGRVPCQVQFFFRIKFAHTQENHSSSTVLGIFLTDNRALVCLDVFIGGEHFVFCCYSSQ